ncbi:TRAP transporter small permease [Bradyrhizobium sp. sBnM-33]|uniref:TRAP transporter small permease n=1 Tax=Bradyrhizobium sp. sBnM-33 TaxID=2831780 RepID=UPI0020BE25E7|nr:TRAP transporter small permease subunit [Bradyrhizobium sp. sBnM-33]WOH49612.1 TRAP transporter small permease subunit [Bradyrhizobium sp. sBnM-33]
MSAGNTVGVNDAARIRRAALATADFVDRNITMICRFVVLVTGIALTMVMTANVVARYALVSGGFSAAQELPERLFPWFIVAGIALAAQAGGHMAVDWLLDRLDSRGKCGLLLFGNAIIVGSYAVLCYQALAVAEIAKIETSPVLGLSGSHGYLAIALGCTMLALAHVCASVRIALLGPQARFAIQYKDLS